METSASEEFAQELAALGAPLPWNMSGKHCDTLVDANGEEVLEIDADGRKPAEIVLKIAAAIMLAVNTCGGFKAEVQ